MKNFKVRACQRCGKGYQPTSSEQKYCVECAPIAKREWIAAYRKTNREKMVRASAAYYAARCGTQYKHVCVQCGKVFTCQQPEAAYCSRACMGLSSRKNKNRVLVCLVCGNEFIPTNNTQKYCSHDCYAAGMRLSIEELKAHKVAYRTCHHDEIAVKDRVYSRSDAQREHRKELWAVNKNSFEYMAKKVVLDKAYKAANPEARRMSNAKRYSLKYANTPIDEMLTSTEWLAILAEANGHCHYCGKEAKLTLDHVIPLSKSGKHSKDNVVPACLHCNSSKGSKTLEEWKSRSSSYQNVS